MARIIDSSACERYSYSIFEYISNPDFDNTAEAGELARQYMHGSKLYCIFSSCQQLMTAAAAIDRALSDSGLVRSRDALQIAFENTSVHEPSVTQCAEYFSGFNFLFSVVNQAIPGIPSFRVVDGKTDAAQRENLILLGRHSGFNAEQYFVEHADPDRNIVVRAGAGSGKTETIISRIGFICYSQNIPLQTMTDRIVMITFTNEAARQMVEKLKFYFKNCYLLSSDSAYLTMISRIEHMQISTIHSYVKKLISKLGTSFGYGIDLRVTSGEYGRRKKISRLLDDYLTQKKRQYGSSYGTGPGMPGYAIIEIILDFIGKLHNQNVDIPSVSVNDFGFVSGQEPQKRLHELLAYIIPLVEEEYTADLLEENRIYLGSLMSIFGRFVNDPGNAARIQSLSSGCRQFMFIDEFQDTDDTQIDIILTLSRLLNYRLFLVGDVKQCIYRFRGAEEKAFDRLDMASNPKLWQEYQLQVNYRTDKLLLDIFDKSFSRWGAASKPLLSYGVKDRLSGVQNYNGHLASTPDWFYTHIKITSEEQRIPKLLAEIKRIQRRIVSETERGEKLSDRERSIAVLVRKNWQAEMIKNVCAKLEPSLPIYTNTGGDLYQSQPALDMMTLVNALVHFDEADYLYTLASSNFFNLDIPKSNLYHLRQNIRNRWRSKVDERDQVNYLMKQMNRFLVDMEDPHTWPELIHTIRVKPILQVIRELYRVLAPWKKYSDDSWKQQYYQLNVDLLFEELIRACNTDNLTINTLQEYLYTCIVSRTSVESRTPPASSEDMVIQCITVHKAKGLEFGHVILPYCSSAINTIKAAKLHVSVSRDSGSAKIGYCLNIDDSGAVVKNNYYDEALEKDERSREETRILYVAMTRAVRSFSWIDLQGRAALSWQKLIEMGEQGNAL